MTEKHSPITGIIKALGLVFGDIGTSPIYTITVVFLLFQPPSQENVLGVLSIMVWTMLTLVTVQYAWIAMNLSRRGEGGTIVLKEILRRLSENMLESRPILGVEGVVDLGYSLML
jgi:KUP system potassium uptake protein